MSQPPSKARRRSTKFVKGLMFMIFATSAIGMVVGGMRFGGGGAPQAPAKPKVSSPPLVQPNAIDDSAGAMAAPPSAPGDDPAARTTPDQDAGADPAVTP